MAVLEHVKERRAAPVGRGAAGAGRSVLERIALIAGNVVPAKAASLVDRMQRVDENLAARQIEPLGAAAFAETVQELGFRKSGQALAGQPVHQAKAGARFHRSLSPAIAASGRLG